MTVHWIDPTSLDRESAMLCLRRLHGHHTFEVLTDKMHEVMKEFELDGGEGRMCDYRQREQFQKSFQVRKHDCSTAS